jgi:hypothetical protein
VTPKPAYGRVLLRRRASSNSYVGRCIEVVSGDMIVVSEPASTTPRRICLASVAGTCAAASWDEKCSENGRYCADGLLCVKPPNSRDGGFPSVFLKVVKSGDACTSYLNRNEPGSGRSARRA